MRQTLHPSENIEQMRQPNRAKQGERPRRLNDLLRCSWQLAFGFLAGLHVTAASAASSNDPGASAYLSSGCSACHGADLRGGSFGPPVVGEDFHKKWHNKTQALFEYVRSQMPPAAPGSLPVDTYRQIVSYLAATNGLPQDLGEASTVTAQDSAARSREDEFASDDNVVFEDGAARARRADLARRFAGWRPVDSNELTRPRDGDWIHFRRTYDGLGHSPLRTINRSNVDRLSVAWSLNLTPGVNQITPLVRNGIIFVHSNSTVQAIDGRDGSVLWTYTREVTKGPRTDRTTNPRGMALHGPNLIVSTVDAHLIALDMTTGAVRWDQLISGTESLVVSAAPLVVGDKVIQGVSGCDDRYYAGGCFVAAFDAATGKELWRVKTIQPPGQRKDTWGNAPLEARTGGSVWSTPSFDPELNLIYVGVSQTYRIEALMKKAPSGSNNDGLYTNSTLALDPDTGRIVWHYQHVAREVWDLDWAFERQLINLPTSKGLQRAVLSMGKMGIADIIDARTGRYIASYDMGLQNLVSRIDPVTGRKVISEKNYPRPGEVIEVCPYAGGVRNWPATAYDPATSTLFVPAVESCMTWSWRDDGGYSFKMVPRPDTDGNYGRVQAIDVRNRSTTWTIRRRAPVSSAILSTAGGLIFEGDRDRWFRASNSETGEVLWQIRLNSVPNGFPVTFEADGEQYVLVTAGGGGPLENAWRALTPEIPPPAPGTVLWAFKLSKQG